MSSWIRGGTAVLALLGVVAAPVEVRVLLVDDPVVAPPVLATALTISSCLLLVWSGLGLRRTAAARALQARPPAPGA
ncbi:MAG TPA: hypothetical protein VFE48_16915 [Methylomirabilota bacterium]|nr:hypothetical protein [Methylomirabilota bacterium]